MPWLLARVARTGERELALGMARYALRDWDPDPERAELVVSSLRERVWSGAVPDGTS